jgi:hypothetical protein
LAISSAYVNVRKKGSCQKGFRFKRCVRSRVKLGEKVQKNFWKKNIYLHRCQMVYFQTKNPNLGKFWRELQWKMLVFLWTFGLLYGHLVYFMDIWYIFRTFGLPFLRTFEIFWSNLVNFFPVWDVVPRQIWQPWIFTFASHESAL